MTTMFKLTVIGSYCQQQKHFTAHICCVSMASNQGNVTVNRLCDCNKNKEEMS